MESFQRVLMVELPWSPSHRIEILPVWSEDQNLGHTGSVACHGADEADQSTAASVRTWSEPGKGSHRPVPERRDAA